jgi:FMN-dependent oxidoreductase (nitrilotriacetate monooxygenase family)
MPDRIHLHALRQNTVGHTAAGLWRHPDSRAHEYRTLAHWVETARIAEAGRFDALFIADALGPLDTWRGSVDAALRDGIQTPTDDPLLLVSALAAATTRLGLAVTVSTTYEQPYQFARKMTTLDHLSEGRIGWNVVTSALESAARNLGRDTQIPHDERYAIAEEFMAAAYRLWETSWEDGAVVLDAGRGVFADPTRVHPVRFDGDHYRIRDIALSEPSVQRTPVIYQAGTSTVGRRFAARHAEGVFLSVYRPEMARGLVDDVRRLAGEAGRDPSSLVFMPIMTVVVDDTDAGARAKHDDYARYASTEGSLARWSALMQIDLSVLDLDAPLEHVETDGIRGMVDLFTTLDPTRRWTPREIAAFVGVGGGGPVVVGSPATVADELERWLEVSGCDGFNIADIVPPAMLRDVVDLLVPELQRRGLHRTEYEGRTLREHLLGAGTVRARPDHPAGALAATRADAAIDRR